MAKDHIAFHHLFQGHALILQVLERRVHADDVALKRFFSFARVCINCPLKGSWESGFQVRSEVLLELGENGLASMFREQLLQGNLVGSCSSRSCQLPDHSNSVLSLGHLSVVPP